MKSKNVKFKNSQGHNLSARIYKMAKHPKSFVSLDDADHLLTNEEDAKYVGLVTAAWANRYYS
jgi:alpha-beta hydrolase superfamily lysophospholipase